MTELLVEVRDRDIVIRKPASGYSITYRRVVDAPMLEAVDLERDDPNREEAEFLVQRGKPLLPKQRHSVGFDVENGLSSGGAYPRCGPECGRPESDPLPLSNTQRCG